MRPCVMASQLCGVGRLQADPAFGPDIAVSYGYSAASLRGSTRVMISSMILFSSKSLGV